MNKEEKIKEIIEFMEDMKNLRITGEICREDDEGHLAFNTCDFHAIDRMVEWLKECIQ